MTNKQPVSLLTGLISPHPWKLDMRPDDLAILSAEGATLCTFPLNTGMDSQTQAHNARLMQVVPELFESCQALLRAAVLLPPQGFPAELLESLTKILVSLQN